GYTYFKNGTRQTVTDPAGAVTSYTYDGQNRLKTATTAAGVTKYTYWPDDLLQTVTYPNNVVASYGYDKADRLMSLANEKILDPANPAARTKVSSYAYTYDDNGNRLSQVETNGGAVETTGYTYDKLNRLATVTYPRKNDVYGYDAVGNRARETEKDLGGNPLSDKQGDFDALNRLKSLTDLAKLEGNPARLTSFGWDPNGNQVSKTAAGATTLYRYDV